MTLFLIIILIIANIPLYKFFARLIFSSSEDMQESIKYTFTPDIFSLFRGRYIKDAIGETKLFFFCVCCAVPVVLEYVVIQKVLGLFGVVL